MNAKQLKKIARASTEWFASINRYDEPEEKPEPEPEDTRSEKAKEIEAFIQTKVTSGVDLLLAKLFSILLGEEISHERTVPDHGKRVVIPFGAVVVVLENPNGHDYPLGDPAIVVSAVGFHALKLDKRIGNSLPPLKNAIRPASLAEIDAVFDALGDDAFEYIFMVNEQQQALKEMGLDK